MKSTTSALAKLTFVLASLFSIPSAYAQGLFLDPGSINFTNTTAGSVSAEQTVSVQFIPSPPMAMSLNVTSMGPPTNSAFAVTNNTCSLGSYTPYATCEVKFTFTTPSAAGPVTAQYSFVTAELGNLNITLRGNSDGAPVVVTPTAPTPVPTTGLLAILFGGAAIGGSVVWARNRSKQQKS